AQLRPQSFSGLGIDVGRQHACLSGIERAANSGADVTRSSGDKDDPVLKGIWHQSLRLRAVGSGQLAVASWPAADSICLLPSGLPRGGSPLPIAYCLLSTATPAEAGPSFPPQMAAGKALPRTPARSAPPAFQSCESRRRRRPPGR